MATIDDVCWCCGAAYHGAPATGPWCDDCVTADRPVMSERDLALAVARLAAQEPPIVTRVHLGEIVLCQAGRRSFSILPRELPGVIQHLQEPLPHLVPRTRAIIAATQLGEVVLRQAGQSDFRIAPQQLSAVVGQLNALAQQQLPPKAARKLRAQRTA